MKSYIPFVVAAVLLALSAVGAIADGDESNPPSSRHQQVQAIEPDAAQALGALRRPRTAADDISAALAARLDRHAPFGVNPELARIAIGNATNSVYVVPANGHVCAILTMGDGADLSCRTIEDLVTGKASPTTVTLETGGIAVYGMVPDGVESVTVQTDASHRDVEVEDNIYYGVVPAGTPLRTAVYTGPSGRAEFTIHDPSAAFGDE